MPQERPADDERPAGEQQQGGEQPTAEQPADATSTGAKSAEPLRVVLHSLEEQVDRRVDKVAAAKPAREESTSELIKLEEELESAQDKAKQLVTLRLKLGDSPAGSRSPGDEADRVDAARTNEAADDATAPDAAPGGEAAPDSSPAPQQGGR